VELLRVDRAAIRRAGARLLVVFGSAARGVEHAGSDLDLGVLFDGGGPEDTGPYGPRLEAVASAVQADRPIDLVLLDEADPLLLREVALDGRPVFEAEPGAFEEFRLRAIKRYLDTAWLREIEARVLRERYG
jgi:predicted nucleotidyltransferase